MNRTIAIILIVAGALGLALGLLFLCAASAASGRLPLAVILLVLGGGLTVGGGLMLRRARDLAPATVADRILTLAQADEDAELTVAEVVGRLRLPEPAVLAGLDLLEKRGRCRREYHVDHAVYVFPGLKESKLIRQCAYCGRTYSVREPLHVCPNCDGAVELVRDTS